MTQGAYNSSLRHPELLTFTLIPASSGEGITAKYGYTTKYVFVNYLFVYTYHMVAYTLYLHAVYNLFEYR